MMNFAGGAGLMMFWGIHFLGAIAFFIGTALLLLWAFKSLSEKELWKWGWILVAAGIIAGLLSMAAAPFGTSRFGPGMMFQNDFYNQ